MQKTVKSINELCEEIISVIKEANITPVQIAYEAGVTVPTVYRFLKKKNYNANIINWYLNKGDK